ncbi:hypothetical protein [Bradyrhizobium oligotrophicum]|uniref:hypothetical protein n=1 Tax=Bradyrhizobium oligotrophicum TaxID=44255 RepID=UPI003EB88756
MRLSLTVALILAVVCEILAGHDGLGHWVLLSARAFRSPDLFAGVLLRGAAGYLTSIAMSLPEQPRSRGRRRHDDDIQKRARTSDGGAGTVMERHDQSGRNVPCGAPERAARPQRILYRR